ncbi:transmembrane protein 17-like [Cimex lectularius]|uniref:Transmembrane protein 17 n=1 Tax=Cimex lectularius TaxID=79782 RepID=A0A8I6TF08_CIMLE|nr:transmembrane protein 17-like [Cimex lectularius]
MWRERVTSVSEHIFPGLSIYKNVEHENWRKLGSEVLSHFPLQITLYFNVIFFPFWVIVMLAMLPLKYSKLSGLFQFLLVLTLASSIVIEFVRLYMGFIGNLKEKIPEIASFWLISVLLQTPLQFFLLLCFKLNPSILETIMQCIMCIFLITQLIFGFLALRRSAKQSAKAFHLSNFQYIDTMAEYK